MSPLLLLLYGGFYDVVWLKVLAQYIPRSGWLKYLSIYVSMYLCIYPKKEMGPTFMSYEQ